MERSQGEKNRPPKGVGRSKGKPGRRKGAVRRRKERT